MPTQLSPLISDGMVLQRGRTVTLWGRSDEAAVAVRFQDKTCTAKPGGDGAWSVTLDNLQEGGPYDMHIAEHRLSVYVGEVWLCGGQSNMELPMRRTRYMFPEEMMRPCPHIHAFIVPQNTGFSGERDELTGGAWRGASPETIEDFSAVGYFFAKRIYEEFGVPVGIIMAAVGGTPITAWLSRESLAPWPELQTEADQCADSGYIRDIQAKDAAESRRFDEELRQNDAGLSENWTAPDYDDSHWEQRDLLTPWEGCGSVWWRKTVNIPPSMTGKPAALFLGTMVDSDTVYLNGEQVGDTGYCYPPRYYNIPALPESEAVVAIRAVAHRGGGFTPGKQYLLSGENGGVDLSGVWRFRQGGTAAAPAPSTFFNYKPTGLYNGMIHPLRRFAIQGALWYQGESDAGNPAPYAEKFTRLAALWRGIWGYDFPICTVELAHWGGGGNWDALRRQQRLGLQIKKTAMAAAFDLGEHNDLHPQNKRTVGERLARCALRIAYGVALPPSPFEFFLAE